MVFMGCEQALQGVLDQLQSAPESLLAGQGFQELESWGQGIEYTIQHHEHFLFGSFWTASLQQGVYIGGVQYTCMAPTISLKQFNSMMSIFQENESGSWKNGMLSSQFLNLALLILFSTVDQKGTPFI